MKQVQVGLFLHVHKPYRLDESETAEAAAEFGQQLVAMLEHLSKAYLHVYMPGQLLSMLPNNLLLQIGRLVKSERIEMLSGGYYDPAFPLISDDDARDQIMLQNDFLKERIGSRPRGIWLTHQTWSPSLISVLHGCGLEYTLLDARQMFEGAFPENGYGYWMTEEKGVPFRLLPVHSTFSRYFRVMGGPGTGIRDLFDIGTEEGERLVAIEQPFYLQNQFAHRNKHRFKMLEASLAVLNENPSAARMVLMQTYTNGYRSRGQIYVLPSAGPFLTGEGRKSDYYRLLSDHDESQWLQKRVLRMSESIRASMPPSKKRTAYLQELFRCQSIFHYMDNGDDYGIRYLRDRSHAFGGLIDLETRIRKETGQKSIRLEIADMRKDGHPCLSVSGNKIAAFIELRSGGRIFELDYLPAGLALCNTLMRRKTTESEPGGDWYRKGCLIDHFLMPGTSLEDFENSSVREAGYFITRPYDYKITKAGRSVKIVLSHTDTVETGDRKQLIRVEKVVGLDQDRPVLNLAYQLSNTGLLPLDTWFGVEFNLTFRNEDIDAQTISVPGGKRHPIGYACRFPNQSVLILEDRREGLITELHFKTPAELWCVPQFSSGKGNSGRIFQGLLVLASWKLQLSEGGSWGFMGQVRAGHSIRALRKRKHEI